MEYIKLFESHSGYTAYTADTENFLLPNVSYCVQENECHMTPYDPRVVAKFNVTSTTEETQITDNVDWFSEIEIDGVKQPSVTSSYTFDTLGEHTVKYTLTDPTSIGEYAFFGCMSLTSIIIPKSVTSIGEYAFLACEGLTSVSFVEGSQLTSIGEGVFNECISLTSINIPSGVTSIGNGAFDHCSDLASIMFAEDSQLTSIGNNAFNGCRGLTSITIPSSVTSIESYAFSQCDSLTSITIPSGVTSIGEAAF